MENVKTLSVTIPLQEQRKNITDLVTDDRLKEHSIESSNKLE